MRVRRATKHGDKCNSLDLRAGAGGGPIGFRDKAIGMSPGGRGAVFRARATKELHRLSVRLQQGRIHFQPAVEGVSVL